jgi:hypothetical protein
MTARSTYRRWIVAITMTGLLNPGSGVQAQSPVPRRPAARVPDVRLDEQGRFQGVVVNGQGQPVAQAKLTLRRADPREPQLEAAGWTATTDARGRFLLEGIPAGTYRLETSAGVYLCRLWTSAAAPPAAAPALLVVNDPQIERGQRPIGEIFRADPLLMATVVAAAIAIPIVIHKSRDEAPEGS